MGSNCEKGNHHLTKSKEKEHHIHSGYTKTAPPSPSTTKFTKLTLKSRKHHVCHTVDKLDFSASALAPAIHATKAQISSVLRSWPAIMESQETIMSTFRRQKAQINAWEDNFKTFRKHCKDTGTDLITVEKNVQAFNKEKSERGLKKIRDGVRKKSKRVLEKIRMGEIDNKMMVMIMMIMKKIIEVLE